MEFREGDLYEGGISITGGEGPTHRWLVVAPNGRPYLQSIDDPEDLHCRPLSAAVRGIEEGRLKGIGFDSDHPAIALQRAKERHAVGDAHLGLHGDKLRRMVQLLDEAVANAEPYTPFAAGEIRSFKNHLLEHAHWRWIDLPREDVTARVSGLMAEWANRCAETPLPSSKYQGAMRPRALGTTTGT